jgi:tRNA(Ile)-lysidine synthase TilS/MesJ
VYVNGHTFKVEREIENTVDGKEYTIENAGLKITGSKEVIEDYIIENKLPYFFSESNDKFLNVNEASIKHVTNSLLKELNKVEEFTVYTLAEMLDDPRFQRFARDYRSEQV